MRALAFRVSRREDELPAPGHGVARVQGKVDDHLLELPRIDAHARKVRLELGHELDVLPDYPPQHGLHLANDVVQVEGPRLEHLPAAESEELTRQLPRTRGGPSDLADIAASRVPEVTASEQDVGVPRDNRHEVVEVVSDAGGESAHRL